MASPFTAALELTPPEPRRPVEDRTRILVAEDDSDFRELLNSALTSEGYEVVEARDGNELIRCIRARGIGQDRNRIPFNQFDLVISDLRMPGASGLEALN